ncbi:MAG: immunoglobulin domain-containing protein [Planctomycetota bacterium]
MGNQNAAFFALYGPTGVSPSITQQPPSPIVCQNSSVSLRATAIGDGTLSYQWQKSGLDLTDTPDIFGTQSNTLVFAHAQPTDSDPYTCVVKLNDCTQTTSKPATLTIHPTGSADLNNDKTTNALDIAPFIAALINHDPVSAALCAADLTGEGIVNDADISPFVTRLLAP